MAARLRQLWVLKDQPFPQRSISKRAAAAELRARSHGSIGISLPTKTGGPDGFPSGDPPGGSTVTA
jgi:hypothetical protein